MKTLDKEIFSNIHFNLNPCLEFACALRIVGKRELIYRLAREMNFNIDKEDEQLLNVLDKGMSKYIRNEMEYFFSICDLETLAAAYVADYENVNSVSELLSLMEKEKVEVMFKYLGGIFIALELPKLNLYWDEVKNDLNKMKTYIESSEIENKAAKVKLLDCYENPEETKQRICFLFKQFYEKSYKPMEDAVLDEIRNKEKEYIRALEANPEEFMTKYFFNYFKIEKGSFKYRLNIHLSLFLNMGFWTINLHDYIEKEGLVILGLRSIDFFNQRAAADRVDKFLKVLSDKRRIDIIKMLSYKPYYGYEIAAKLELTPATVNYHINLLMDADILTFDREENKIYFTLNKGKIKELFKETGVYLINEPL